MMDTFKPDRRELYKALLPALFADPTLIRPLLFAGNTHLYAATLPYAYADLEVEVFIPGSGGAREQLANTSPFVRLDGNDCCKGHRMKRKLLNVLSYPEHAKLVRRIHFRHPCYLHLHTAQTSSPEMDSRDAWEFATTLLGLCSQVEELHWETGIGIGGDLWKAISILDRLDGLHITSPPYHPGQEVMHASAFPRITPGLQDLEGGAGRAVGQGGLGLGKAWETLKSLTIMGLSQTGARSLATHFHLLKDDPAMRLRRLVIHTHFMDQPLLASIADVGRGLRHLELGTTGTKLSTDGIRLVMEECTMLLNFKLNDVEGRLDKNTWRMIEAYPDTLETFEIDISDSGTGTKHSWALQHLASVHHLPICQLKRLAIRRVVHPLGLLPFPPHGVLVPQPPSTHVLTPFPADLLGALLTHGQQLEHLCVDWWQMTGDELELLLGACRKLTKLEVALRSSPHDIINMTTAFANVPDLVELDVAMSPFLSTAAPLTRSRTKAKRDSDEAHAGLPPFLAERIDDRDPTLPDTREMRKFIRRSPNLRVFRWTGREGKGEWRFPLPTKKTTLSPVEFVHSAILTKDIWEASLRDPPTFDTKELDPSSVALEPPATPLSAIDYPELSRARNGDKAKDASEKGRRNKDEKKEKAAVALSPKPPSTAKVVVDGWTTVVRKGK
ncbi:hypothetical protein Q5752_000450 [Cryptotrichosporon argae]